jgi:hypothetical protein
MLVLSTACGGGDDTDDEAGVTTTAVPTEQPGATQAPVGVIAIGHSDMNGQNSNPDMPGWGAPQNSWPTGTSPEFESVYERLVAIQPQHEGHVFNAAEGGATSDALAEQAEFAMNEVPSPALVMMTTIGNDIRCDGTDGEATVRKLCEIVARALQVITEASPQVRILIVGRLGSAEQYAEAVAGDEYFRMELGGSGMCDLFTPAGEVSADGVANENRIFGGYEAEQARVCAEFPQCSTDGDVLKAYQADLSQLIPKDGHLNVAGQAAVAELIWPTVEALMTAP